MVTSRHDKLTGDNHVTCINANWYVDCVHDCMVSMLNHVVQIDMVYFCVKCNAQKRTFSLEKLLTQTKGICHG